MGQDKHRKTTYQLPSHTKQSLLRENEFNSLSVKNSVGWWETKTKIKSSSPHSTSSSQTQCHSFIPNSSTSSQPLECLGGDSIWGLWSVHNNSSLRLLPPHTSPAPARILSMGLQFLAEKPGPVWCLHRPQFPSGHIHLLQHGVLHRLQYGYLLQHGLQGNLCSCAWSTSSPSLFTNLGSYRVVLQMFSHSSLTTAAQWVLPLFSYTLLSSELHSCLCQHLDIVPIHTHGICFTELPIFFL